MKLSALAEPLGFTGPDIEISGLSADSRAIRPGELFAALPGTQADGRDYIDAALANGAEAVMSLPGLTRLPVSYVASDNPRRTYAIMAARLWPGQPETVVAMTGTNGKSSTIEFLRQLWQYAGLRAACFGTLGVTTKSGVSPLRHTTPDAVALHKTLKSLAEDGITHAGMEASSHGLVQCRLDGVRLAAVGFSNLSQDHFDYHANMEDYFQAKARLFNTLAGEGTPAVINVDGDYGQRMAKIAEMAGLDVMRVGWAGRDIRICEITPRRASQTVELEVMGKRCKVELPLAGEFQALNAISALGLAMKTGVTPDKALEGLTHLQGVPGRMQLAGHSPTGAPVFIDFAHTPDGLETLLRSLRPHTQGALVIVFGCGGDRDKGKRPKMGEIAARLADRVIVTDDNPRTENAASIRRQVLRGCPEAREIGDRREAIAQAIGGLEEGDCLVIAGKGHEQGQIVGKTVIPFSDLDVARELLLSGAAE